MPFDLTDTEIRWAKRLAAHYARKVPHMADEFEGAAMVGLVQAAISFDPARGFKFLTHATPRVVGQIKDEARGWMLQGYRRGRAEDTPHVVSLTGTREHPDDGNPVSLTELLDSREEPVGSGLEWQDELRG